jgi:YidC/Oxa1 family membrane protein insertase
MSSLFGVPVDAAYHLVFALASVLTPVLGGFAAVAGIILFTGAVRLAVTPLTFRALRGQAAQARLAPHVRRLRERYGKQPERLQRELTALYRREGTSVFAGFGPLLVQWPVFSVVYLLFRSSTIAGGPNRLLSHDLFGVPLSAHWLSGAGLLSAQGAVFLGVLALLGAACWLSSRVARRMSAAIAPAPPEETLAPPRQRRRAAAPPRTPAVPGKTGVPARTGVAARRTGATQAARKTPVPSQASAPVGKSGVPARTSAPAQSGVAGTTDVPGMPGWLTKALPYLTVVIAAFAPLAAVIYLITSTTWSAAERLVFAARAQARAQAR